MSTLSPGSWSRQALCRDELAVLRIHGDHDLDWWDAGPRSPATTTAAKLALAVCRACPVVAACAEHGLKPGNRDWMILGGLMPDERAALAGSGDGNIQAERLAPDVRLCKAGLHDLNEAGNRAKVRDGRTGRFYARCRPCHRERDRKTTREESTT